MHRLIIFDIDGTLLLTGGAGKMAFDRVFEELYQISGAWKNILPDGRTDPSLIAELCRSNLGRGVGTQEFEKIQSRYERHLEETLKIAPRFRLMPGVTGLLPALAEQEGVMLGLATGNFERAAYLKLERAGLREYFQWGGFGSDHGNRMELTRMAVDRGLQKMGRSLEPEQIFLVGDTVHDIRCGQRMGLTTVAVATGSTPYNTLASLRPDFLLENLEPLADVVTIFT